MYALALEPGFEARDLPQLGTAKRRQVASPAATSPLRLVRFDASGSPVFHFTGPEETFIDDPSQFSRWRAQFGIKYLFN